MTLIATGLARIRGFASRPSYKEYFLPPVVVPALVVVLVLILGALRLLRA